MKMWRGVIYLGLCLTTILPGSLACPHRCLCFRTTVRCMFLQLEQIPQVPSDTMILDLRFNKIKTIPRGVFNNLSNLKTLLLNNNELESLDAGAFQGLVELRYLYLYKNKIETIHSRVFRDTPKLEQLFLHSNKLKNLPRGVFASSKHLRRLRLDSNALVCDCQLMWLSEMLKEKHGYTQAAATCEYPANLQGRSLMSVPKDDFHCEYQDNKSGSEMPRFTMEPRDVDVTFGNTAYFTCRAEGTPNPEIVWFHNNEEVEPDNRLTILSDGTLMIQETKDTDQGAYECVARNAAGEVKANKVELRYFGDPVIPSFMETPADITDVAGHTIQLLCRAVGNPQPDITWTKNGSPLRRSPRFHVLPNGALMIRDLQEEDEGLYRCSAANSVQTISTAARVTIQTPPAFFVIPRDLEAEEGDNADFSCNARGDPTPVLSWSKDGRPLPSNHRYTLQNGGRLIRILNTESSDSGRYTCKAENAAGEQEASARLHIISHIAPSFTERSLNAVASPGSDISMECQAEGSPTPHYQWRKAGRRVHGSQKFILQGSTLTVRNLQSGDSGRYDCIAQNVAGRSVKSVNLQVQTRPGFPRPSRRGDNFVRTALERARSSVNTAINDTLRDLFDKGKTHGVEDLLKIFRYPSPEALELARAEEIFEQTLSIIYQHVNDGHKYSLENHEESYRELVSPSHLALIANMSGCESQQHNIDCSNTCFHRKYRTFDGTCNNFNNPDWGASNKAFIRLMDPIYENGFNTPVGWSRSRRYNGQQLPSPRLISSLMMSTSHVTEDEDLTHMLMQWGQFADHDMSLAPQSISFARFSDGRRCNETCDNISPCFPISVPNSDDRVQTRCLGFSRTSATCNTGSTSIFFNTVSPRQQINSITSFIDASNVYGSTQREAESLRDLSNNRGLMRVGSLTLRGSRYLPFDDDSLSHIDCQIEPGKRHVPCFRAGDHRANEHVALTAMHTLWLREHNRIATIFSQLNPHWDGNKVYHETRKLMGGVMQHITLSHWLPNILGPRGMELVGPYKGYDPSVNPSISNEFATSAMRFGHSLVQPVLFRLNETFQPIPEGNLPLHKAFFSPYKIMEEGGIDPLLRGLFGVAAKKRMPGELLNSELTEKLFSLANSIGQDLASLNIQRGRDHGLPFYNSFREFCNMSKARSFSDLRHEIRDRDTRSKLQDLYGHPDNIDVFVGGMAETPLPGAKIGPTFMCVLANQFKRIRDGDRFWYERPGAFSTEQMIQIQQSSLARVICDNTDTIDRIQLNVFKKAVTDNDYKSCDDIPSIDLRMWTDCCEDCRRSNNFQSFARHFRGRRSVDYSYPEPDEESEELVYKSEQSGNMTEEKDCNNTLAVEPSVLQDDVMLLDSRLEWMEASMAEMIKNYNKLKKKMRNMQKVLEGRSYHCKDHKRKKRVHGEKWKIDPCKICQCKKGQVECESKVCPPVSCAVPVKVSGQCCATCN